MKCSVFLLKIDIHCFPFRWETWETGDGSVSPLQQAVTSDPNSAAPSFDIEKPACYRKINWKYFFNCRVRSCIMNVDIIHDSEGAVMEIHSLPTIPRASFPPALMADIQNDYKGTSPYHVNYCGYQQCSPGHKAGPFIRTSYLIHVVVRGSGIYYYHGKIFPVQAGQAFLIYPGETTTYIADHNTPWEYGWVGCSGYRIPELLREVGFTEDNPVLSLHKADTLMSIILSMMDAQKMTLKDELFRTAELLRFFGMMLQDHGQAPSLDRLYSGETYAQVALRYLNDNYMYKISISDLASTIGVERSYLWRVFLQEYHESPQKYLQRLRMEKARSLLESSTLSIADIASRVGYDDYTSFTKMFRQKVGMSPTEYRAATVKKDSPS